MQYTTLALALATATSAHFSQGFPGMPAVSVSFELLSSSAAAEASTTVGSSVALVLPTSIAAPSLAINATAIASSLAAPTLALPTFTASSLAASFPAVTASAPASSVMPNIIPSMDACEESTVTVTVTLPAFPIGTGSASVFAPVPTGSAPFPSGVAPSGTGSFVPSAVQPTSPSQFTGAASAVKVPAAIAAVVGMAAFLV
ncbi:hypothetical protein EJ04DRAFT_579987 [Polyplosphaeria fusca]|uniref:Uncharacterized protein n=1 Tax=Polyplosphaeria fusca TaxID=682080 RepID=A0A9P4QPU9_9PLEO|nr:hypothetical protein EJ04DRAFT_579987 [Polyplosphaeria fusca]